jgi:hypothetical protein
VKREPCCGWQVQRGSPGIRLRDKVLLVLSAASIESAWVEGEVEKAFEEERQRGGLVLFPVRLDDAVLTTQQAGQATCGQPSYRRLSRLEGPRRLSAHARAAAARPARGGDINRIMPPFGPLAPEPMPGRHGVKAGIPASGGAARSIVYAIWRASLCALLSNAARAPRCTDRCTTGRQFDR